ncbi:MAG: hypothetical protein K1000chlam2_01577 [Chlamydiae bacterium]|nr:hypothetical protein [Chlamydiota bacterium]
MSMKIHRVRLAIQLVPYPFYGLAARKIYFASLVGKVHLHLPFLKNLVSFPLARAQSSDRGQVELVQHILEVTTSLFLFSGHFPRH